MEDDLSVMWLRFKLCIRHLRRGIRGLRAQTIFSTLISIRPPRRTSCFYQLTYFIALPFVETFHVETFNQEIFIFIDFNLLYPFKECFVI